MLIEAVDDDASPLMPDQLPNSTRTGTAPPWVAPDPGTRSSAFLPIRLHRRNQLPGHRRAQRPRRNHRRRHIRCRATHHRSTRGRPHPPRLELIRLPVHRETPLPRLRQVHDRHLSKRPVENRPLLHLLFPRPLRQQGMRLRAPARRRRRHGRTRRTPRLLRRPHRPHSRSVHPSPHVPHHPTTPTASANATPSTARSPKPAKHSNATSWHSKTAP